VRQFGSPDDLPCPIIHQSQTRGLGSWINFESQGCRCGLFYLPLKHQGKWEGSVDRSLTRFEQQAGASWMHRSQRLLICIYDKNL
jgi:hypothetical protein